MHLKVKSSVDEMNIANLMYILIYFLLQIYFAVQDCLNELSKMLMLLKSEPDSEDFKQHFSNLSAHLQETSYPYYFFLFSIYLKELKQFSFFIHNFGKNLRESYILHPTIDVYFFPELIFVVSLFISDVNFQLLVT